VNPDTQIQHLEKLRDDARDEIKRRIQQRDNYSVQQMVALAATIAIAFSNSQFANVLLIAPLASIYFTVLLLYSYLLHDILTKYIRVHLEPELSRLCGTPIKFEFETYYKEENPPGIRKVFFYGIMWVVILTSLSYIWYLNQTSTEQTPKLPSVILIALTVLYPVIALYFTYYFRRVLRIEKLARKSEPQVQ
jgi:hypothetical protein